MVTALAQCQQVIQTFIINVVIRRVMTYQVLSSATLLTLVAITRKDFELLLYPLW